MTLSADCGDSYEGSKTRALREPRHLQEKRPCDLAALAPLRDPGLDTDAGLGGSNEAEATTGSDALNRMDSVRPDGYRDRRLSDGLSDHRRRSGVL
jgi:hypothetical protein